MDLGEELLLALGPWSTECAEIAICVVTQITALHASDSRNLEFLSQSLSPHQRPETPPTRAALVWVPWMRISEVLESRHLVEVTEKIPRLSRPTVRRPAESSSLPA